ncbi:MAG: hypothetical protein NXI30_25820 [bacterium]|nr:hypothetical protein [bacterium]
MADGGLRDEELLEGLLGLAHEAELEVRVLSAGAAAAENAPTQSAAARVGARIWVVLAPNDPPRHQARILAETLARHRSEFLEERFVAPALRDFIERVDPLER